MWSRPPNVQNEPYGIVAGSGWNMGERITVTRPDGEIADWPTRTRAVPACSVAYDMGPANEPFDATELADMILGEGVREIQSAYSENDRIVFEAVNVDATFETKKRNVGRDMDCTMMQHRNPSDAGDGK